mmetsp:Transcript_41209/g.116599  ORF Transcript_41209/g.116599 Transcript_41209/m.116599 type:complete len:471 (+) Transcript_41209:909-2321(+)
MDLRGRRLYPLPHPGGRHVGGHAPLLRARRPAGGPAEVHVRLRCLALGLEGLRLHPGGAPELPRQGYAHRLHHRRHRGVLEDLRHFLQQQGPDRLLRLRLQRGRLQRPEGAAHGAREGLQREGLRDSQAPHRLQGDPRRAPRQGLAPPARRRRLRQRRLAARRWALPGPLQGRGPRLVRQADGALLPGRHRLLGQRGGRGAVLHLLELERRGGGGAPGRGPQAALLLPEPGLRPRHGEAGRRGHDGRRQADVEGLPGRAGHDAELGDGRRALRRLQHRRLLGEDHGRAADALDAGGRVHAPHARALHRARDAPLAVELRRGGGGSDARGLAPPLPLAALPLLPRPAGLPHRVQGLDPPDGHGARRGGGQGRGQPDDAVVRWPDLGGARLRARRGAQDLLAEGQVVQLGGAGAGEGRDHVAGGQGVQPQECAARHHPGVCPRRHRHPHVAQRRVARRRAPEWRRGGAGLHR